MRMAVNTGEALVKVNARPELGEAFVAGDVVNTAARLQSVAPVRGILVGERTARMIERWIHLECLEPVIVKGKSDPVRIWKVVGHGSPDPTGELTPFVGRTTELAQMSRILDATLAAPGLQLLTIFGEPGIGKSRLVRGNSCHPPPSTAGSRPFRADAWPTATGSAFGRWLRS